MCVYVLGWCVGHVRMYMCACVGWWVTVLCVPADLKLIPIIPRNTIHVGEDLMDSIRE